MLKPCVSVMIPTWQPDPEHLAAAIDSVLAQVDPSRVEIAIVDDCSPAFDPPEFARRYQGASALVTAHRHPARLGIAGNWNACITMARGTWIHILHQDDLVLPGFYEALLRVSETAEARPGAAFCPCYMLSGSTAKRIGPPLVPDQPPGVLRDWQTFVFERLIVQCAAVLVRREVYESLGGFDPQYRYALDWDMWKRIAARYPIAYHPEPLACYRVGCGSETMRHRAVGNDLVELFQSIAASEPLLPASERAASTLRARANYLMWAVENAAEAVLARRDWRFARRYLDVARRQTSAAKVIWAGGKVGIRSLLRTIAGSGS